MTDTQELDDLIVCACARGAVVTATYDSGALQREGRRIYQTVQVRGLAGVGPEPMSPLSAAEVLRIAVQRALHKPQRSHEL